MLSIYYGSFLKQHHEHLMQRRRMLRRMDLENLLFFSKRRVMLLVGVVSVIVAGCSPSSNTKPEGKGITRSTWNAQVLDVRKGQSDIIKYVDSEVTPEQAEMLKVACQKLRVLHIDQSKLSHEHLADFLALVPQLKQLKLVGPVDHQQLTTIAKYAQQLEILNLPDGRFDDEGMKSITKFNQLNLLRFQAPDVTNTGIKHLVDLPELKFLHLIDVSISDDALQTVSSLPKLESFYLDGSRCTDEGLSQLIKERPNLHFHWNQLHLAEDPQAHQH